MFMAEKSEKGNSALPEPAAAGGAQQVQLGIRLQPVDHSDQPVFANFSTVQVAPGMVFLDFGFLEPSVLPSVMRLAQSGGKVPESVNGRLAARMVLGLDTAIQLAQQLEHQLRSLKAQAAAPTAAAQALPPVSH
jgi:hypothetical protein